MTAIAQTTRSLTQAEAEQRGALLDVEHYEITVDLTGLLEGECLESLCTVRFRAAQPGATSFVDCRAAIQGAILNGRPLDLTSIEDGRLPLPDLRADNVLTVKATQTDTSSGAGIMRSVDPSDGQVYVWTSFEADDAQRAWACFDQPDLKAPHRFTVLAPRSWTVTSNTAPESIEEAAGDARRWLFPDTPPLSTYVVVVNAGPFHELRREIGGHSLGLYCRHSLAPFLDRDAEELFALTAAGLAFFGEQFGMAFPQERYDHVFVPNMGGAMENWGCVTWSDSALFRSAPTYAERAHVASVLLHEMAHMWFGDLVTMRWWDDLWLNEAFASWAATWASAHATPYTDAWATFLAGGKLEGYRVDRSPATHAIRGEVPDVAQAMANFDAITYLKGQSVLRQLVAHVGEGAFLAGLGAYFREHAWGSTRLADLMTAVGAAAGQDLTAWSEDWFDRAGLDTLTLADQVLYAEGPDGSAPRTHHLAIASFRRTHGELVPLGSTTVRTSGRLTDLPYLPPADLHLPNDQDLTFAAVRPERGSVQVLLDDAGLLPDPLSRVLATATAWDMLLTGELSSGQVFDCLLGVLATETSPGVIDPLLSRALRVAEQWSRPADARGRLVRLAEVATGLVARRDVSAHDVRAPALRTLAASASTAQHFAMLDAAALDDRDLAWRTLVRRSSLGEYDANGVAALLRDDPDPDVGVRALGVLAARPDQKAKAQVWSAIFSERSVPAGSALIGLSACFWRPRDQELMLPWAHRYLDEVESLGRGGGMLATSSLIRATFPTVGDQSFLERATAIAEDPGVSPTLRSTLLAGSDTLARMLRARR